MVPHSKLKQFSFSLSNWYRLKGIMTKWGIIILSDESLWDCMYYTCRFVLHIKILLCGPMMWNTKQRFITL